MIIYDKAAWQIDGGIPAKLVVSHFNIVFKWLKDHNMLSADGEEEFEDGIDDCASLNERLVTKEGAAFLDKCYDDYIVTVAKDRYGMDFGGEMLEEFYHKYLQEQN